MSTFQAKFIQIVLSEVEAALLAAATPAEGAPTFDTAEAARDHYVAVVMADLSRRLGVAPQAPAAAPAAAKKRKTSPKPEAVDALSTKLGELTVGAGAGPVAKPKKGKATPVEVNLAKIDPTWRKYLKSVGKTHGAVISKDTEASLLSYLNALSKEDFNARKAEEHIATFLEKEVASAAGAPEIFNTRLVKVEFEGKEYYVDPEDNRVYQGEGGTKADGSWAVYTGVGYVGAPGAFAEMEVPAA